MEITPTSPPRAAMFTASHQPRTQPQQCWGIPDLLFVIMTLAIMQHASRGMLDDPGLGWHLRLPDLMIEQGGFVYDEYFCFPTAGNRWVAQSWLCDWVMRGAYAWGGLQALAVLTSIVFAATLRGVYRRLQGDGYGLGFCLATTVIMAGGLVPSFVARPNMISFLGVWLVADLCQRFHAGRLSPHQLWWLVPIMLVWANMHGGFLAGMILLAVAWTVEGSLALAARTRAERARARQRWWRLSAVSITAALATCINPNGLELYSWSLGSVTDPFIQRQTTVEWRPPDFTEPGWTQIELLILLFPLLAALTRRQVNLVGLAMSIVFLHFALIGRRYTTLWVVVAAPTLCELAYYNAFCRKLARKLRKVFVREKNADWSAQTPAESLAGHPGAERVSWWPSFCAAGVLLILSPWLPFAAGHHQEHMPSESLNRFLNDYHGERVFHSANWGGYLVWHGWERPGHFRAWIDDRIEVHGKEHLLEYFRVLNGEPNWQDVLDREGVTLICIPRDVGLVRELQRASEQWKPRFTDAYISVYERRS